LDIYAKNQIQQLTLNLKKGDLVFAKSAKVSAELVALTYGALVTKLLRDN
jgi:hypothetical protein